MYYYKYYLARVAFSLKNTRDLHLPKITNILVTNSADFLTKAGLGLSFLCRENAKTDPYIPSGSVITLNYRVYGQEKQKFF